MKYGTHIIICMVIIGVLTLLCGCIDGPASPEVVNPTSVACHPNDYTNGVYYFSCYDADFGNALSVWKREHPDQIVTAIAVNDRGGYGYTIGYFVSTEPRGNITKV